jgi:hypothetical protein
MRKTGLIGLLLLTAAGFAWAQPGDPPSRVARLNLVLGPVSFRPGSVEEWAPATLNYPLTIGDHLWTEPGSRAELHVGSTAIRMDGQTALSFLNLDDQVVQLSITGGNIDIHIRDLAPDESYEVDTPNAAISLLQPGDYRISGDADQGVTFVVVRGGEAEVTGGGTAAFPIRSGESASIRGTDFISQEMGPAPPFDEFDQWAMERERREASSISARYVPRDMIGYEDLDQYGVWSEAPQYGWVWRPTGVGGGWAPYHDGHWVWVDPWGWTWVDDAPWGFAPFHYGRWAMAGGAWVWVPGRRMAGVRPVYAPALVAFVGGPGFSVAVGFGGGGVAAWFPLGPGEAYRPAYRVSERYVRNVNIVHVTNVTVINNGNMRYMNQNVAGAVMVVPHETFAGGRPVARSAMAVRPGMMAQAQVVETAGVAPTRAAVLGHSGPMNGHAPPARFEERTVVVRHAPPPPPVSFAAKEQALRGNGGRPLEPAVVNNLRPAGQTGHPMVRNGDPPAGGPYGPGPGNRQMEPRMQPAPAPNRPMYNDRPGGNPRQGNPPAYGSPRPQSQPPAEQRQMQTPQPPPQPRYQERPPVNQSPPAPRAPEMQPRPPAPNEAPRAQPQEHKNDRPAGRGQVRQENKNPEK